MSAAPAPSMSVDPSPQRGFPRHPIFVPLDVIVLRSGIPESLPGRCTDLNEGGVGAIVAGELLPAQQVALELRLPNMGVPVQARALVRYQQRLRCGFQFVGLSAEQREMIRYWSSHVPPKPAPQVQELPAVEPVVGTVPRVRKIRIRLSRLFALLLLTVVALGLGWWQWERSWGELEGRTSATAGGRVRVSPEIMESRITFKVDPSYPETARQTGLQGIVVLNAVIGADGTVKRLHTISGPDLLAQSATAAVASWKFEPYRLDGKPKEVETSITVEFRLQ